MTNKAIYRVEVPAFDDFHSATASVVMLLARVATDPTGRGTNPDVGLPPRTALTTLLSTESLIFAAFAITVTLALPTAAGRSAFYTKGFFGGIVIVVLALVATAAFHALVATLRPIPPEGWNEWVRAVGLGIGICAQPLLAIPITVAAVKTRPPAPRTE